MRGCECISYCERRWEREKRDRDGGTDRGGKKEREK